MRLIQVKLWKHGLVDIPGVINADAVTCAWPDPCYTENDVCWVALAGSEKLKVSIKFDDLCKQLSDLK